jgi:site-specific DNA recombinase
MRGRKAVAPPKRRRAAAYLRVSTQEQGLNGYSIDAQEARLRALSAARDSASPIIYVDNGASGGTTRRRALQELIRAVRAGEIEAVLVTKLDRLSRSLDDLLELLKLFQKHAVALVSATESIDTESVAGKMLVQLLGVFAEFERGRIGERTREILSDRRRQRKVYSRNVPFGFRNRNGRLVEEPRELRVLVEMRRRQKQGASLRQIAKYVASAGIKPRTNSVAWHPQVVKDILSSRMAVELED